MESENLIQRDVEQEALNRLVAGIRRQQQNLRSRDPWLPRSGISEALEEAWNGGSLLLYSSGPAGGVVGVLETDGGVSRLLGPVVEGETPYCEAGRALMEELCRDRGLAGRAVKVAVNSEFTTLWRLLEEFGFRRYNAEMSLTFTRQEWSGPRPGRKGGGGRVTLEEYESRHWQDLRRLHPPNAYFSADVVAQRTRSGVGRTIVARDESRERVIGYIYYEVEAARGEICFVNVSESARGRGVGTRLIEAGLEEMFSFQGTREVEISVRPDNPAADLYRRIGFSPVVTYFSYERRF